MRDNNLTTGVSQVGTPNTSKPLAVFKAALSKSKGF